MRLAVILTCVLTMLALKLQALRSRLPREFMCSDILGGEQSSSNTSLCQCTLESGERITALLLGKPAVFCRQAKVAEHQFDAKSVAEDARCSGSQPYCGFNPNQEATAPIECWGKSRHDALVIGGGPAGVEAAVEIASLKKSVALVEPKDIFGVPSGAFSKALRTAAIAGFKSNISELNKPLVSMFKGVQSLVNDRLESNGVTVIKGWGKLLDPQTVRIRRHKHGREDACRYAADAIFLATGSQAWRPDEWPSPEDKTFQRYVFDSDTINDIDRIPKHLIIQGAGIVAIEFAIFFSKLGSNVTMLVRSSIKLSYLDTDLKLSLMRALAANNIKVLERTELAHVSMSKKEETVTVTLKNGNSIECDALLAAVGRRGRIKHIGLSRVGIHIEGSKVKVNEVFHTGVGNVYAIGDLVDGKLASVAKRQAHVAVQAWSGNTNPSNKKLAPIAIWSVPETASVGLTQNEAEKQSIAYGVVTAKYSQTLRGVLEGSGTEQYMKIVYRECERGLHQILGVHIFGDMANDLLQFGSECIEENKTLEDLRDMRVPAVTFHELYTVAAKEFHCHRDKMKMHVPNIQPNTTEATSSALPLSRNRRSVDTDVSKDQSKTMKATRSASPVGRQSRSRNHVVTKLEPNTTDGTRSTPPAYRRSRRRYERKGRRMHKRRGNARGSRAKIVKEKNATEQLDKEA